MVIVRSKLSSGLTFQNFWRSRHILQSPSLLNLIFEITVELTFGNVEDSGSGDVDILKQNIEKSARHSIYYVKSL